MILITKVAIYLHNLLLTTESTVNCPPWIYHGQDGAGNFVSGYSRNNGSHIVCVSLEGTVATGNIFFLIHISQSGVVFLLLGFHYQREIYVTFSRLFL